MKRSVCVNNVSIAHTYRIPKENNAFCLSIIIRGWAWWLIPRSYCFTQKLHCASYFSTAVIKHHDQQLGSKGFSFISQLSLSSDSVTEGRQDRDSVQNLEAVL